MRNSGESSGNDNSNSQIGGVINANDSKNAKEAKNTKKAKKTK